MALKDAIVKESHGFVASSDFPLQTKLYVSKEEDGERKLVFVYPNKETYTVTHDKVRYAAILCLGIVGTSWGEDSMEGKKVAIHMKEDTPIYGIKYKAEFTDGKVAIITAYLGVSQRVEAVLF